MIASFSAVFPWYQAARGRRKWTLVYMPLLCLAVAGPMLLMDGWVRRGFGLSLLGVGGYLLWRRARTGWRLEPPEEPAGGPQPAEEQTGSLEGR
ncbi:MAG: hypothetical protein ACE5JZ_09565 [Kiloniellales bacterium]